MIMASDKYKDFRHGLRFLPEAKKVQFTSYVLKKSKRTGRNKESKREIVVCPTTKALQTLSKRGKTKDSFVISDVSSIVLKKGGVELKVVTLLVILTHLQIAGVKHKFAFKNGAIKNQFCLLLRSVLQGPIVSFSSEVHNRENLNIFVTTWK